MSRQSPKKQIASRDTASERISHAIGENAIRHFWGGGAAIKDVRISAALTFLCILYLLAGDKAQEAKNRHLHKRRVKAQEVRSIIAVL